MATGQDNAHDVGAEGERGANHAVGDLLPQLDLLLVSGVIDVAGEAHHLLCVDARQARENLAESHGGAEKRFWLEENGGGVGGKTADHVGERQGDGKNATTTKENETSTTEGRAAGAQRETQKSKQQRRTIVDP